VKCESEVLFVILRNEGPHMKLHTEYRQSLSATSVSLLRRDDKNESKNQQNPPKSMSSECNICANLNEPTTFHVKAISRLNLYLNPQQILLDSNFNPYF
jgi:hypothetical protein